MIDDGTFVKGNNWFWGRRAIVESVRGIIYLFLAKTYACFESRGEILIYFKIVGKEAVFIMIDSRCASKAWDSSSDHHVCGVVAASFFF